MIYQWNACDPGPTYMVAVDWNNDGGLDAGNFEDGFDDWADEGPVTITRTTSNAYTGQYSLLATWDAYAGTGTAPRIHKSFAGLTVGDTYSYRAWTYLPTGGMPVYLSVNGVASSEAAYLENTWQQTSLSFTAASSTHVLEALPVTYPAGGSTLSTNPYLVTSASGWSAENGTVARSTDQVHPNGVASLLLTPNGVSVFASALSDLTSVGSITPGNSYKISMWAYSVAGWSDVRPTVYWFTDAGAFISTSAGGANAILAGQWTYFEETFTAPLTAGRARARARHGATPAASDTLYVWAVRLNDLSQGETSLLDHFQVLGPDDDVTLDVLAQGVTIDYGRDQDRQLAPGSVGRSSFMVCNTSRDYSPENIDSPLFGELEPARPVRMAAAYGSVEYPLFTGRIDDFDVNADRSQRNVSFTALDTLSLLQGFQLSTALYRAQRSGDIVNRILDEIGWTAGRDIDPGGSYFPYWWSESDAFTELQNVVLSEGPPAVAYVAPDGTFTFKDRHHRLLDANALTSQAAFASAGLDCDSPAVTGFDYTDPFVYQHGWRDIINSVSFSVDERRPDPQLSFVWETNDTYAISAGETIQIDVETPQPFMDATSLDVDFTGAGTLTASINRDSGQSARLSLTSSGGSVVITAIRLEARSVPVVRTVKVMAEDSVSIAAHGKRTYPNQAPWANVNDAGAIASVILGHYAERRPTVKVRVTAQDPSHLVQVLTRTISDRITIRNAELGLDSDFYIESVSHTIRRLDAEEDPRGLGPVHAVVLGCERVPLVQGNNPFTFDKSGAGFDDGAFGVSGIDDPGSVFIFDHATQGQFDVGLFGT